jgi:hypothetical protein
LENQNYDVKAQLLKKLTQLESWWEDDTDDDEDEDVKSTAPPPLPREAAEA